MLEANNNIGSVISNDEDKEKRHGPPHLTATIGLFRSIIDYCRDNNVDVEPVLLAAGLEHTQLNDIDSRIGFDAYMAGFVKAEELSDDPFFGLHFGEQIKPGHYGIVGIIAMSCSRARELIHLQQRYQALVANSVVNTYQTSEQGIRLTTTPLFDDRGHTRLHVESTFSSWITLTRWLTGLHGHYPTEVSFPYSAPDDLSEYHRIFGSELLFDQASASVLFPSELIDTPIPQSNPALRQQLEAQANELLLKSGCNQAEPLLQEVQQLISASLADGTPDVANIAEQLRMSTRVLQRQLRERDTNFSKMLDSTREELATSYIKNRQISLTEIAFLLGFSEQSAFNRAFKRWTRKSPTQYRKNLPI